MKIYDDAHKLAKQIRESKEYREYKELKENKFSFIMYDKKNFIKLNCDKNYCVDLTIIPLKNIRSVNYSEMIYVNCETTCKLEIFLDNGESILLDTKPYINKTIFKHNCEFIQNFVKEF